ncbi:MAG: class I SAM-dependent methyltransferase [Nanoarchaeota archaeon]
MAEYDKIAQNYSDVQAKRPGKIYMYNPSLFNLLGNLKNKTVLDLACGDGVFSREIKLKGASEVLGVDISREMIKIAQDKEKQNPLGIKYIVNDVLTLNYLGEFDLIVGGLLLHYSKTKQELLLMCKNIYKNLKKTGRFIALNNNPDSPLTTTIKYGSEVLSSKRELNEGDKLTVNLVLESKKVCSFHNYYWTKKTYEECLKVAGFKNIKWHQLSVSEEGIKKYGKEFWQDYYNHPYMILIEAEK